MNTLKGKKLLLLPLETRNREFLGKLRLAIYALDRGYDVLIGSNKSRLFDEAKSGFLLYKDHSRWNANKIKLYKENGLILGALDEEGHIIESEEKYLNDVCDAHLMKDVFDVIFLWGNEQSKIIRKFNLKNKIEICGNPRFDISSLYYKKNRPNKNLSNVRPVLNILVNTRFAYTVGHINQLELLVNMKYLNSKNEINNFKDFLLNEEKIFNEFINLVECLGVWNDVNVILRPHPNEKMSFYDKLASRFNNINVNNSQELNEQIDWADFVIHDGCTTALEAKCQGKNVIGLRPVLEGNVYPSDANKVSLNFENSKDLVDYLKKFNFEEKQVLSNFDIDLTEKIANWRNINMDSVQVILDKIDNFNLTDYEVKKVRYLNLKKLKYKFILHVLSILVEARLPFRLKNRILMQYHIKNKYPTISKTKFDDFTEQLELLEKRKFMFEFERVDVNVFLLKKS